MRKIFHDRFVKPSFFTNKRLVPLSSEEQATLLDRTPDSYTINDWMQIFSPSAPAGTYEEMMYFFPFVVDFLENARDDDCDLVQGVVTALHHFKSWLASDGFLVTCHNAISDVFALWTNIFEIHHMDAATMRQRGSHLEHYDFVIKSQLVSTLLDELALCGEFDLLVSLLDRLSFTPPKWTTSAWLLEIASGFRLHGQSDWRKIYHRFSDDSFVRAHWQRLSSSVEALAQIPRTYFVELSQLLGLTV